MAVDFDFRAEQSSNLDRKSLSRRMLRIRLEVHGFGVAINLCDATCHWSGISNSGHLVAHWLALTCQLSLLSPMPAFVDVDGFSRIVESYIQETKSPNGDSRSMLPESRFSAWSLSDRSLQKRRMLCVGIGIHDSGIYIHTARI